jgi:hypothetical protein
MQPWGDNAPPNIANPTRLNTCYIMTSVSLSGSLDVTSCQLTIDMVASLDHSQLVHHLRIWLVAMAVDRLIALITDPNTLPRVNTQVYQACGVVFAELTLHLGHPLFDYLRLNAPRLRARLLAPRLSSV